MIQLIEICMQSIIWFQYDSSPLMWLFLRAQISSRVQSNSAQIQTAKETNLHTIISWMLHISWEKSQLSGSSTFRIKNVQVFKFVGVLMVDGLSMNFKEIYFHIDCEQIAIDSNRFVCTFDFIYIFEAKEKR